MSCPMLDFKRIWFVKRISSRRIPGSPAFVHSQTCIKINHIRYNLGMCVQPESQRKRCLISKLEIIDRADLHHKNHQVYLRIVSHDAERASPPSSIRSLSDFFSSFCCLCLNLSKPSFQPQLPSSHSQSVSSPIVLSVAEVYSLPVLTALFPQK